MLVPLHRMYALHVHPISEQRGSCSAERRYHNRTTEGPLLLKAPYWAPLLQLDVPECLFRLRQAVLT